MELKVPIGFKFLPMDTELIGYLADKILTNSCDNPLIRECNFFRDDLEIWDLWSQIGGDDLVEDDEPLYFFSTQPRVSRSRFCRRIGSGTWSGEDSGQKIKASSNVTGIKKRFRYETEDYRLSSYNGGWIMHVYSVPSLKPANGDDLVLCRIKKNPNVIKKRIKHEENSMDSNPRVVIKKKRLQNSTISNLVRVKENGFSMNIKSESDYGGGIYDVIMKELDMEAEDDGIWHKAYSCLPPLVNIRDMKDTTMPVGFDVDSSFDVEDMTMPGDPFFDLTDLEDITVPGFASDGSFYAATTGLCNWVID